ncbi:MAG: bifunctional 23S rRNA (guanine(2069)-N(7))-methyltransferase RlmK/23S rRNA (guanine(2445)-N(2))-methyltransferase RlmL [Desulfobulbus propionicus]|nr:MAG: bifunctional 23S rRNA (guanine(2069)-N(7))-methyltransferase RlmK/23S rRNA (guanine(2445)-N(2))-methyltransferase RlmL [Desulfobulbus propionicus]
MATVRKKPKSRKQPLVFTATCGSGLEAIVQEEILACGGKEVTTTPGAVHWTGTRESAYRACLWSRFASRILLQLKSFAAPDTDTLYEQVSAVKWDEHFDFKKTFAVFTTLVDAQINHSQYASLRVKDAIVDQFRKRFGKRPDVDSYHPHIRLNLHINGVNATLSLDFSGDSLHRRGYRTAAGEAPLKETLAAALIHLSGFMQEIDASSCLLDPMCGSGTLLIEAALMLSNTAPGLLRKKFGFNAWAKHDHRLWELLINEALEKEDQGISRKMPQIIGYDADPRMIATARKNVVAAGMREFITIRHRQAAHLHSPATKGFLITNPPYGDRLSDKLTVKYLYRFFGRRFRNEFKGWKLAFFTGNPDLAAMTNINWQKRYKLFNGPIKCQLLMGEQQPFSEQQPHVWTLTPPDAESSAPDLANRIRKNCQQLFPWAEQEGISCFRIYDRDIPEFNLAIDIYDQWLHVQEYAPPSSVAPEKAEQRFSLALTTIRKVLGVPRSRIFFKTRQKQKGKDQYQKKGQQRKKQQFPSFNEVHEGGNRFLVNFTDYLDTGLFLDHRNTRRMIADLAQGKSFLNLFGYTGSATVYAAQGGASATTTVDVSETYLNRARANLSLNGFGALLHQTVTADCMEWLRSERSRFGLIFVDPPTFSNSRHRKQTFDIQKDHKQLLELAMNRLSRNGKLIFSTNFKKFKLDPELEKQFVVEELTEQTVPRDFARKPPIHRSFLLTHPQMAEDADFSL